MAIGKVLIIDDDPDIRAYLVTLLAGWGFKPLTAENGADGVALAAAEVPSLILLDLNMRGMTGFETARRIRATPELAAIPILALTALRKAEDRDEAHFAGCNAVLSKPIETKTLYEAVTRNLGEMHA